MSNSVKKTYVTHGLAEYIEALDYTKSAMKTLLIDAAERGIQDTEAFKRWEQRYEDATAEFAIAKAQIERDYVLPLVGDVRCNWSLSYHDAELTIEVFEK